MATAKHTAPAEAHRLTLVSYPDDVKITVIKIIREYTDHKGLKEAKDAAEALPAVLTFAGPGTLQDARTKLEEAGAVVTVEPIVDSEVVGDEPARCRGDALFEAIEEQRHRLYELEALLRAAQCTAQVDQDANALDTLLDLAGRMVAQVNRDLDVVSLRKAAEESQS